MLAPIPKSLIIILALTSNLVFTSTIVDMQNHPSVDNADPSTNNGSLAAHIRDVWLDESSQTPNQRTDNFNVQPDINAIINEFTRIYNSGELAGLECDEHNFKEFWRLLDEQSGISPQTGTQYTAAFQKQIDNTGTESQLYLFEDGSASTYVDSQDHIIDTSACQQQNNQVVPSVGELPVDQQTEDYLTELSFVKLNEINETPEERNKRERIFRNANNAFTKMSLIHEKYFYMKVDEFLSDKCGISLKELEHPLFTSLSNEYFRLVYDHVLKKIEVENEKNPDSVEIITTLLTVALKFNQLKKFLYKTTFNHNLYAFLTRTTIEGVSFKIKRAFDEFKAVYDEKESIKASIREERESVANSGLREESEIKEIKEKQKASLDQMNDKLRTRYRPIKMEYLNPLIREGKAYLADLFSKVSSLDFRNIETLPFVVNMKEKKIHTKVNIAVLGLNRVYSKEEVRKHIGVINKMVTAKKIIITGGILNSIKTNNGKGGNIMIKGTSEPSLIDGVLRISFDDFYEFFSEHPFFIDYLNVLDFMNNDLIKYIEKKNTEFLLKKMAESSTGNTGESTNPVVAGGSNELLVEKTIESSTGNTTESTNPVVTGESNEFSVEEMAAYIRGNVGGIIDLLVAGVNNEFSVEEMAEFSTGNTGESTEPIVAGGSSEKQVQNTGPEYSPENLEELRKRKLAADFFYKKIKFRFGNFQDVLKLILKSSDAKDIVVDQILIVRKIIDDRLKNKKVMSNEEHVTEKSEKEYKKGLIKLERITNMINKVIAELKVKRDRKKIPDGTNNNINNENERIIESIDTPKRKLNDFQDLSSESGNVKTYTRKTPPAKKMRKN